ncbi:FTH1 [Cordylochernes scorpioides]|uniref:Ferritin n=1 Tax=Cordylochernes scorpioides TaxID=51811 RepID=A0ABY6JUP9_9ARAC|nr:FTH1 [Cordylochernes scorpioides]
MGAAWRTAARQNYPAECEDGVNRQIQAELYASYSYLAMAQYFDRDDVGLQGYQDYFQKMSLEEFEHAQDFVRYQNRRGGRVKLWDIKASEKMEWDGPLDAMKDALELEKSVNQKLLNLHFVASEKGDAQLCDFLEANYLTEQVEAIKSISDHMARLRQAGPGLGEVWMDHRTDSRPDNGGH